MAIQQEWFTVDEAAEYLRVSKRTIYELCAEGYLVGYRTSSRGHRRFRKEDLDKVMKRDMPESGIEELGLIALTARAGPLLQLPDTYLRHAGSNVDTKVLSL